MKIANLINLRVEKIVFCVNSEVLRRETLFVKLFAVGVIYTKHKALREIFTNDSRDELETEDFFGMLASVEHCSLAA